MPRTAAATLPADFVLVEEPASEADALDERMVLAAAAGDVSDRAVVTVRVKAERREALRRFSAANAGLSMAVVLDGVLLGLQPVPKTDGETLDLALWPKGSVAGPPEAADLAVVLAAGRLPWPLMALPLEPTYGTDPPADNLISRAFTVLDERAIPTLERIAAKAPLSWSRSSARWALDQIKASSGAPGK